MFPRILVLVSLAVLAISPVSAHPVHSTWKEIRIVGRTQSANAKRASTPEFDLLRDGNTKFKADIQASDPGLLKKLTDDGQSEFSIIVNT